MIQVGDLVTVQNPGKLFAAYDTLARAMGLTAWKGEYYPLRVGEKGKVLALHQHLSRPETMVAGVRIGKRDLLIGTVGPGRVPDEVEFDTFYLDDEPLGVYCQITEANGMVHFGTSWCNIQSGDEFDQKVGEELAFKRAQAAKQHQMSAYYQNGDPMFLYNVQGFPF